MLVTRLFVIFHIFGVLYAFPRPPNTDDDSEDIVLVSKDGHVCLQGTLDMDIVIDYDRNEDDMMEITRQMTAHHKELKPPHIHVDTSNVQGLCYGEEGNLNGVDLVGPAIIFQWNDTWHHNYVLLLWKHEDDSVYLNSINVTLVYELNNRTEWKHLHAEVSDLMLFKTPLDTFINISRDVEPIEFNDIFIGGLFVFEHGDIIFVVEETIPVLLLSIISVAAIFLLVVGAYLYVHGSRQKKRKRVANLGAEEY